MKLYNCLYIVSILKAVQIFNKTATAFLMSFSEKMNVSIVKNRIITHPMHHQLIKHYRRNSFFIALLIFSGVVSSNSKAATITSSTLGGVWNSTATWVGGTIPTSSDDVIIANSAIVTSDLVTTVKSLTIGQGASGILQWNSSNNLITISGNVIISSGASLLLYTTSGGAAALDIGGDFINNGFANLAIGTLNFKGSQISSGNSSSQTLSGTGTFAGQDSSGIIRSLNFQTTGTSTISTSQNLIVTLTFTHSAGTLNTNGKLSINNTAQVYGQALNTQVANIAVTNMGSGYTSTPVVSASGAALWVALTAVSVDNILVSGTNVYAVTSAGNTGVSAPTHTSGSATDGATLLWVGNTGTIGNALIGTVVLGTQYFYGNNLYTAVAGGAIDPTTPPTHLSGIVTSGVGPAQFLYAGHAAQVSVNHDVSTGTLRSLALTNSGSGLTLAPSLSILASAGSGATATVVFFPKIDGLNIATTTKGSIAAISGGIIINSNQGASSYSGVGGISTSTTGGGVNYTVAPTVGFAGPTAINLVTAQGTGYSTAPTITVTGGTLISGSALTTSNFLITVDGGKVVSVYLNLATTACYSAPPTLAFAGGAGSGATLAFPVGSWPTATALVGANRQVSNFTITNSGFGYVAAPTVSVGTSGTFTSFAFSLACRIALYNLIYNISLPNTAATNTIFNESAEVPSSRKINSFTMNSSIGAIFSGNLELFSAAPLTLTNGKADFGSNTLTYSNASYSGVVGSVTASISGIISLSSIGGSVTKTFPFNRTVVVTTGTGSLNAGSTITSLTITRVATAPTGTVSPVTNFPTGTRIYRLQTNGGAVYGTTPTVQLNYGSEDGLLADSAGLLIARASATTGPWTVVSASIGTGALAGTGSRTTSTFAGSTDDYLAFTTTFPQCTGTPPTAGTIPSVVGFCTASSSVTITLTGYPANNSGLTFLWEQSTDNINFVNAIGINNSPVYISPVISTNTFYRCKVTCSFGGISAISNTCKAGPVICQYNITRNTGVAYISIINTGTVYSSWSGGAGAGNDEVTNAVSLSGTTFLYQGVSVNSFFASTNGFISFNSSLANASPTNNLTSATNTQILAPFWDDLVLKAASAANHDNCMRYKINGALGSGSADIIIEWANMERLGDGVPNINFQVVLHESGNTIDFNYGNFQLYNGSPGAAVLFTYSVGLNGTSPGGGTLSDRMILQRANQNFFGLNNPAPALSLTPECSSQLHFIPVAAYSGTDPGAPVVVNDNQNTAITVPVNSAPCIGLCGNLFKSAGATASPSIPVCSAGGDPDDDVWFKFKTTTAAQYKVSVTPGINYDAVVQLIDSTTFSTIICVNSNAIGVTENLTASLTATTTYYIRVYDAATGSTSNGEFALCVSKVVAPNANDECAGATTLTVGSTCTPTASILPATLSATASTGIPLCTDASPGLPDDDVWYTFTTNAVAGAIYNIIVSSSSLTYNAVLQLYSGTCGSLSSVTCINATGNGGTESITTSSLSINTVYHLRIYHAGGGAADGIFSVCVFITAPPCAVIQSPVNGTPISTSTATLKWADVVVATDYDVYYGTDSSKVANDSISLRHNVQQPADTLVTIPLSPLTTYYWKVVPISNTIRAAGCSVNNFNTKPPECVSITSPLNSGSICYKTSFVLSWSASFGASGYDVYLKKGAGPADSLISPNQAGTSFTIPVNTLNPGQWAWRIAPKNAIGTNTTCSVNTFTINIPPVITISTTPPTPAVCPGQSITLTASGATTYTWSPSTALNTTTGSSVISTPATLTTYSVTGENVSGCSTTVSQQIKINPVPVSPVVTSYSMCTGGTIPPGSGLTANCVSTTFTDTIIVALTTPGTNEGIICPGTNLIGTFTIPQFPNGATLISARLTINGITLNGTSNGSEIRLNFSGNGINPNSTCFQGAITPTTPNPVNWVTGVPVTGDTATLVALLNINGGIVNIKYNESVSQLPGSDVTFPGTGSFTYTYSVSSSPKWYSDAAGTNEIGSGSVFNPFQAPNPPMSNIPGTYIYYARCVSSLCPSASVTDSLVIGQPVVVNTTQSAPGPVCSGTADPIAAIVSGGSGPFVYSWSPATGLSNTTISSPVAIPSSTTTYTVSVTDACNNSSTASITVTIITPPTIQVSPSSIGRCISNVSAVALTATPASVNNYTWSPATGLNATSGETVLASPTTSTVYTVTGTSKSNGCTAKVTATITVGDTLKVTATASPTSVCQNGTSQLNSSVLLYSFYCVTTQGGSPAITNVSFNTLSNPGIISVTPFFETYPFGGNTTTTIIQGSSYNLTVDAAAAAAVGVWIDYNRNGTYDATEFTSVYTSATTGTILIPIPADAVSGVTGMRVRSRSNSLTIAATDACSNTTGWGSCQNYMITIGNPPPSIGYNWSPSTFLNNTAISNPFASNVTGPSNTYTVTATNLSGGCTATASVTLTISPFTSVAISPTSATICAGKTQTFTSTPTGGSPPYTYSWAPSTGLSTTTGASVIASPTTTTTYTLTVKDFCNATILANPVTLTVNPSPNTTVSGNPSSLTICTSGSINLTANGATSYSWSPSYGLNSTITQSVTATPLLTTVYTVTGTTNTCSNTASITVNYSPAVIIHPTADVNPGCTPLTTQLHANAFNPSGSAANYLFSSGSGALNSMTGSTELLLTGSADDNTPSAETSIGFNFTYEGIVYSTFSASPDGWVKFGPGAATDENVNNVISSSNIPKIYPYWDDVALGLNGNVKTLVSGTSPNRILVIQWFVIIPRNLAGNANTTFQAWLYENSGKIEFRYGAMGIPAGTSSVGITGFDPSHFNSVTISSGNTSNITPNNNNPGKPVNGGMYTFTPSSFPITYLWSPSGSLNSSTLANPTLSNYSVPSTVFTVTATNSVGCTGSGTFSLTVNTTPAAPQITVQGSLTFCQGQSVLLTASAGYTSYSWSNGTSVVATTQSFSATVSGTYAVTGFVANGCSAASSGVTVNVMTATTPVITYPGYPNNTNALNFCPGGSVLLNATGSYNNYSWSKGGPPLGTNATFTASTAGTFRVTVTASNGCTATSSVVVTLKPTPPAPVITAIGNTTLCDDGSTSVILKPTSNVSGYGLLWSDLIGTSTDTLQLFGDDITFLSNPGTNPFNLEITDPVTTCKSTSNTIHVTSITCGNGILFSSKIFLEGYYTSGGYMKNGGAGYLNVVGLSGSTSDVDTVLISAMAAAPPHNVIGSKKGILQINGNISVLFGPPVVAGNSYYIQVKHHNCVETWSANPVLFTSRTNYLFSTNASQAFCSNMVETPDHFGWALYSGDINQDGSIDAADFLILDPSIQNGEGGYNINDLDGNGAVDALDFLILDPNIQNGIGICTP